MTYLLIGLIFKAPDRPQGPVVLEIIVLAQPSLAPGLGRTGQTIRSTGGIWMIKKGLAQF